MGAWGSEPLANDDAWDFVNQLAATSTSDRHGLILTALTLAATAESWLDVDDANGAVMAAFLVATARSPSNYPEQRQQLIETVSSVYDIHSLADLVGSMRTIRSAKVATLALRAIDRVAGDSELSTLWADDADFAASLEALRAALRSPVRRWKTTDEPMPTGEPLRRRWAA